MSQPISQVWTFASDSNPDREYQTLRYTDRSLSCNCPGWTRRLAADGSRSCKHTRWVDLGQADHHSIATHNYEPLTAQPQPHHAQSKTIEKPSLGQRRFAV
ncbi:MAG: hypothetical protein ABMA26_01170 [Limisphaerales bacterium]